MIRFPLLLTLIATQATAQDADPVSQLIEGYLTCFMGHGDPDVVAPNLGLYGWTHEAPSDGIAIAYPGAGDETFVLIFEDSSACHVESLAVGTVKAAETLALALPAAGTALPDPGTDALGCALFDLGSGITATLTSGGTEPVCTSDTTSTVRFDFALTE
jgi:hypothetical protein